MIVSCLDTDWSHPDRAQQQEIDCVMDMSGTGEGLINDQMMIDCGWMETHSEPDRQIQLRGGVVSE